MAISSLPSVYLVSWTEKPASDTSVCCEKRKPLEQNFLKRVMNMLDSNWQKLILVEGLKSIIVDNIVL